MDDRVGVIVLITVTKEEYEEETLNVRDTVGVLVVTKLVELKKKIKRFLHNRFNRSNQRSSLLAHRANAYLRIP